MDSYFSNLIKLFGNAIVRALIVFIVLGIASVLIFIGYIFWNTRYNQTIYPYVFVNGIDLSGMTKDEAVSVLDNKIAEVNKTGFLFLGINENGQNIASAKIYPIVSSLSGDLAYPIVSFEIENAVDKAWKVGRNSQDTLTNLKDQIYTRVNKRNFSLESHVNVVELMKILKERFVNYESQTQDAKLIYNKDTAEFSIDEEKIGSAFDYNSALINLERNLRNLNFGTVNLVLKIDKPKVYKKDVLAWSQKANALLNLAPLNLVASSSRGEFAENITRAQFADFFTFNLETPNLSIASDREKTGKFLTEKFFDKINKPARNASLILENGKVKEFGVGEDGEELDIEKTIANINGFITQNTVSDVTETSKTIAVAVKKISALTLNEIDNLGIKEIIGVGRSNFFGSPTNRRKNIAVGAATINGVIISANEEFSLLKALGPVNKDAGYYQELVIKDGKTVPEYGGGLCQIGTTMFRAALNSGLPITMRVNHSYRVGYYEPAGTDATIYDPWPDFKFVNDTGNAILVQTHVEGDDAWFEFWGTKDGRMATSTYPKIYNIVKPPETKLVETDTLKPGEKKCTEKAHNGADAYFDYMVKYPDGISKEKRFKSHYVPWQEVCLIGIDPTKVASSTVSDVSSDSLLSDMKIDQETATSQ